MFSLSSRGLNAACTLLLAAAALSGCSDERLSPHSVVNAGTEHHSDSELDRWIRDSITLPYGIEVVYRPGKSRRRHDRPHLSAAP